MLLSAWNFTCHGNTWPFTFPWNHSSLKMWFNLSFTFLTIIYTFKSISHYWAFQLKMRKSTTMENLFQHSVKSFDTWQRTEVGQNARSLVSAQFHYYELQNFSSLRLAPLRIRKTSFPWSEVLLSSASLPLFFPSVWHTQLRQCLSLVALHPTSKGPKMLLIAGSFMRRPNLQSFHKCNIH